MAPSQITRFDVAHRFLPRPQYLALLQDEVRAGTLTGEDVLDILITRLNPIRIGSDGRIVGMHKQLARTRFADIGGSDNGRVMLGTPPQRHAWDLADRKHEPIRKGSSAWRAMKGAATRDDTDINIADVEPAPKISWGQIDRGRDKEQRLAARSRCASRQPSSLSSSWLVGTDAQDEADAEVKNLEKEACESTEKLDVLE